MKSSASESIRNACFNLERLSRSFRLAWPGISPLERLWSGFDSDAELFMFGECPLYFSALQNSQNVFKVFILTVTIRSPQVQLSDTRTVTKTARKSTRSYSFIAHSLATQEFPVIVDFIYWFSLHSCQNAHVLFVTQYHNNTFPTHSPHMVRYRSICDNLCFNHTI